MKYNKKLNKTRNTICTLNTNYGEQQKLPFIAGVNEKW